MPRCTTIARVKTPVSTRLVIGPNASLSGVQAVRFFAATSAVCMGIAAVFAWAGFWPVLPFAGLELAALGAALWVVQRRNRYREVLRFEGDRIIAEFGMAGAGAHATCSWPRGLTRVWLEAGPHAHSPTRLVLACGAQRMTVGGCLTDEERRCLAARLKELVHPAWTQAGEAADRAAGRPV